MTAQEARKLKIGTRVKWESSQELGTLTEKGEAGVRVMWDDGMSTVYLYQVTSSGLLHLQPVLDLPKAARTIRKK